MFRALTSSFWLARGQNIGAELFFSDLTYSSSIAIFPKACKRATFYGKEIFGMK